MVNGVSDVGVAQLSLKIEDPHGEYVNLREAEVQNVDDMDIYNDGVGESGSGMSSNRCWLVWWWARLIILLIFVGLLAAVFIKWVGPFVMNKEIIPLLNWVRKTFRKSVLAAILFASVAVFPVILVPSTPSMWVAGMTFGYSLGFLIIISAVPIGVSLPYFIGTLFHRRMEVCTSNIVIYLNFVEGTRRTSICVCARANTIANLFLLLRRTG